MKKEVLVQYSLIKSGEVIHDQVLEMDTFDPTISLWGNISSTITNIVSSMPNTNRSDIHVRVWEEFKKQ